MIFVGKSTKTGCSFKSYDIAKDARFATHVKLKGSNEFFAIQKLPEAKVSIEAKGEDGKPLKDSNGNPIMEKISVFNMERGQKYFIAIDASGALKEIELELYNEVTAMNKADNGRFVRCDDGTYFDKSELMIPAYKKLNTPMDHFLTSTYHNEHYAYLEQVELKDGTKITLPNENVAQRGNKWFYTNEQGETQEVKFESERVYIDKLLVGDKIIDAQNLKLENGEYFLQKGLEKISLGKVEVKLNNPFVSGSSLVLEGSIQARPKPQNAERQQGVMERNADTRLKFSFDDNHLGPDGLKSINVNSAKTEARFKYADGHEEVYWYGEKEPVQHGQTPTVFKKVSKFNFEVVDGEVKFDFYQSQRNIATDVVFEDGKLSSYKINGVQISDIQWTENDGVDEIAQYSINGIVIRNIKWNALQQIESCDVVLNYGTKAEKVEHIKNMAKSEYATYAITYKLIENVKNVKWATDGIESFELGDRKFTEIEWLDDGTIRNCKINGEFADIQNDPRYEQLKLRVATSLNDAGVVPLLRSKLLSKDSNGYKTEADVVQTSASVNGEADAKDVTSVEQAMNDLDEFRQNPFATFHVGMDGSIHSIDDINTTYNSDSQFNYDAKKHSYLSKCIGKNPVEYNKGKIKVKPSKLEDNVVFALGEPGIRLCYTVIGFPFGLMLLAGAGVAKAGFSIARKIKEEKINHIDIRTATDLMQQDIESQVKQELNALTKEYYKKVKRASKEFSQAELSDVKLQLKQEFEAEYLKIAGKLQLMNGGTMACSFDLGKKAKLTPENYLAYLQCLSQKDDVLNGKKAHPDFNSMWRKMHYDDSLSEDEKLEKEVELYKKYGGKHEWDAAYQLQKRNWAKFMTVDPGWTKEELEENKQRYFEEIKKEYEENLNKVGSLQDRKDYFCKHNREYLLAGGAERRKLLREFEEKIIKDAEKQKTNWVQFETRLNEDGQPLIDDKMNDVMTNMNKVSNQMFEGDNKRPEPFNYGNRAKMSENDKAAFEVEDSYANNLAKQSSIGDLKSIEPDYKHATGVVAERKQDSKIIHQKAQNLIDEAGQTVQSGMDYISLLKAEASCDAEVLKLEEDTQKIDQASDMVKHIQGEALQQVKQNADASCLMARSARQQIQDAREDLRSDYEAEMKQQANEQYIENYRYSFDMYTKVRFIEDNAIEVQKMGRKAFLMAHQDEYDKYVQRMKSIQLQGKPLTQEELVKGFITKCEKKDNLLAEIQKLGREEFMSSNSAEYLAFAQDDKLKADYIKNAKEANGRAFKRELAYAQIQVDEEKQIEAHAVVEMSPNEFNEFATKKGLDPNDERTIYEYYIQLSLNAKGKKQLENARESAGFRAKFLEQARAHFGKTQEAQAQQEKAVEEQFSDEQELEVVEDEAVEAEAGLSA